MRRLAALLALPAALLLIGADEPQLVPDVSQRDVKSSTKHGRGPAAIRRDRLSRRPPPRKAG